MELSSLEPESRTAYCMDLEDWRLGSMVLLLGDPRAECYIVTAFLALPLSGSVNFIKLRFL